ncbi:Protein kinase superfamily protein [Zostera marina]|uniref:Protein kinase superfamily protein n=1 Tax=Zostera marina TaxID=29655 RepID=A0A0K9PNB8_ZOSMR|nr:Protein kinase superfamily protein [Zostera marina]
MATKPWTIHLMENLRRPFVKKNKTKKDQDNLEEIAAKEQKAFSYKTLVEATANFSSQNKLGEGGFGAVYKGTLRDGRVVAVKKLSAGSKQGTKEFMNEALLLSRVQHRNIVNLHGYHTSSPSSSAPNNSSHEKILVYEYVQNESLDKLLFNQHKKRELDWITRYQIITGVARGILYLHENSHTPIIHRDIKPSNILLDQKWVPKIADFGMARLYPEDQTHVNTRISGTNGYMAPEYLRFGQLSTKSDVFSFGTLILELVSGHRVSDYIFEAKANGVLEWAWKLHKRNQTLDMMDYSLAETADADQLAMCIHIALLCTQADPKLRPDMSRLVIILSKKKNTLLEQPTKPGFPGSSYGRSKLRQQGSSSHSHGRSSSSTSSHQTVSSSSNSSHGNR